MSPWIALVFALALALGAGIAGAVWRQRTGRARATTGASVSAAELGADGLGPRATVVQFSTEYCSPCRATRTMLAPIVAERDGVEYVDVDLTALPHLAARFGIAQTPTVLLADGAGAVRVRIGGAPRREELIARLDGLLKETHVPA